jgi:phosphopantothenoylcysteine decarboxylase
MWTHPFTTQQLDTLRALNYTVIEPIHKNLACGDVGLGAMEEVAIIVKTVKASFPI